MPDVRLERHNTADGAWKSYVPLLKKLSKSQASMNTQRMAIVKDILELTQEQVSEAQYNVKIAMSEILKRSSTTPHSISKITMLRDARRMLEEAYRLLDTVKISETEMYKANL